MVKGKELVLDMSAEMLAGGGSPAQILHVGITPEQLSELSGCVRRLEPSEFWHQGKPLNRWVGQDVLFVLKRGGKELARVLRVIESIKEKPAEKVTKADLQGTLAGLAVRECSMTFLEWFHDIHPGGKMALVIRVRKP